MPTSHDKHMFQGRLEVATPFEIGQFLLLGNKTGALHLEHGNESGMLYVLDGQIVSAVGPDLKGGPEAAMRMLSWTTGTFRFVPEPVAKSEEIGMHTENLLLEAARRMDETGEGEQQVAAAIEQADELSRTFAAISSSGKSEERKEAGKPLDWLLEQPGRQLVHRAGHALYGWDRDRSWVVMKDQKKPDPALLLDTKLSGPPLNDWIEYEGRRLYLSWGQEGYRLVHPIPRAHIEAQMGDVSKIRDRLASSRLVAVFAQPGGGRDILLGVLTLVRAASGVQTHYISGLPAIDIEDGRTCVHQIVTLGSGAEAVREGLARWQPDLLVADYEVHPEIDALLGDAYRCGVSLMLAIRATDPAQALRRVAAVAGEGEKPFLLGVDTDEAGFAFHIASAA